jgi:hypothetical protein
MYSKKMGRIVNYAALVLVIAFILTTMGCNIVGTVLDLNYMNRLLSGSAGLGI